MIKDGKNLEMINKKISKFRKLKKSLQKISSQIDLKLNLLDKSQKIRFLCSFVHISDQIEFSNKPFDIFKKNQIN